MNSVLPYTFCNEDAIVHDRRTRQQPTTSRQASSPPPTLQGRRVRKTTASSRLEKKLDITERSALKCFYTLRSDFEFTCEVFDRFKKQLNIQQEPPRIESNHIDFINLINDGMFSLVEKGDEGEHLYRKIIQYIAGKEGRQRKKIFKQSKNRQMTKQFLKIRNDLETLFFSNFGENYHRMDEEDRFTTFTNIIAKDLLTPLYNMITITIINESDIKEAMENGDRKKLEEIIENNILFINGAIAISSSTLKSLFINRVVNKVGFDGYQDKFFACINLFSRQIDEINEFLSLDSLKEKEAEKEKDLPPPTSPRVILQESTPILPSSDQREEATKIEEREKEKQKVSEKTINSIERQKREKLSVAEKSILKQINFFSRTAKKEFWKTLNSHSCRNSRERILETLSLLRSDPESANIVNLRGIGDLKRAKAGSYRISYIPEPLTILSLDRRKEAVYRRLQRRVKSHRRR